MKVFWSVIVYMVISGIIGGYVVNEKYKDCGSPIKVSLDFFAGVLILPVIAGFAIAVDDDAYARSTCKE